VTHRFYADENFPLPVVEELRRLGHDVLTMYEDGRANQSIPDEEVLALATGKQRALLTTTAGTSFDFTDRAPSTAASSLVLSTRISSGRRGGLRRRSKTW
jgi:hypothetical protein